MKIVFVSAEDIRNGTPQSITNCPIAIALKRKFPKYQVDIGGTIGYVGEQCFSLSKAQRAFILEFDNNRPVLPHIFFFPGL